MEESKKKPGRPKGSMKKNGDAGGVPASPKKANRRDMAFKRHLNTEFAKHPELISQIRELARMEMRPPHAQVIYMIKKYMESVTGGKGNVN